MRQKIGTKFLMVLIGSLLVSSAVASDSLMDSREYMTKTYNVLNVDTNGTKMLDTNNNYQVLKRIDPAKLSDESYYSTLIGTFARPKFYIRHGDSINLVPPPAKNDTLKVFYFARGSFPYSDTVNIILPSEYRWAVVYAAAGMCELRRGNFDKAEAFEKLYQQEVARLRTRFELEGITE